MRLLVIFFTIWTSVACGQVNKPAAECKKVFDTLTNKEVYNVVDIPARVTGGWHELYSELEKIRIPKNSETDRVSILISFIVESNGQINGISTNINDPTLDNELLKCLRKFEWKPGACKGTIVPTKLVLSIKS